MEPKIFGIHLKTSDLEKSLSFYLKFGFKPDFAYGPKEFLKSMGNIKTATEKYRGVTFKVSEMPFEIAEDHIAIKKEVFHEKIKSSKVSAMIDVESVAEVRKICEENNFEIAKSEREFPWGTKEIVIRDPDGFILVFRELLSK